MHVYSRILVALALALMPAAHAQGPATPPPAAAKKRSATLEIKASVAGSRSDSSYYYRGKDQSIAFTGTVNSLSRDTFAARAQWWILAKDADDGRVVHDCAEEPLTLGGGKPATFQFGGVFEGSVYRGSRLLSGRKFDGWAARILGPDGELLAYAGTNEELKKIAGSPAPFPKHQPKPRK